MKILVFENEYDDIENAFNFINEVYFNNTLEVTNYPRSQNISDLNDIKKFDLILIDIDLSSKSHKDGYALIRTIELEIPEHPPLVILTGQQVPADYVNKNELKQPYEILDKPLDFAKLKNLLLNYYDSDL